MVINNSNIITNSVSEEVINQEYERLLSLPEYRGINEERIKREVELEALMRTQGLIREQNKNEKAIQGKRESQTAYGKSLLKKYIYTIANAVDNELDVVRTGKPGCSRSSLRHIKDLDSPTIAYLSLKTVIDCISQIGTHVSLQNLGFEAGKALENESRCRLFEKYASIQYEMAVKRIRDRSNFMREKKALESFFTIMNKAAKGFYGNTPNPDLVWEHWPHSDTAIIGVKLLTLIADQTGLIKIERRTDPKSNKKRGKIAWLYYVSLNDEIKDWVKDWASNTGLMTPVCLPTVIPPRPYNGPLVGGYHTDLVKHYNLVKTHNKAYFKSISKPDVVKNMAPVYNAVNTAMSTAWKINTKVYEVMSELWSKATPVDCLPPQEELPVPLCPVCGKPVHGKHPCFTEDNPNRAANYGKFVRAVKYRDSVNKSNRSKALIIHKLLWIASLFKDDPEIYFPYQLDFRGRIYALPQFLNPQGSDPAKGLLTFAQGKPISDETASNWLAIHVANTYGKDKCSFEERIAWTHENTDMIKAIASDPMGTLSSWTNADSPFCFLAACFEWAELQEQGYGYVSHLPVALDGTCSGLQHYSAMLRDETGGSAVNLTPSSKPSDIYGVVAERTIAILRAIPVTDTENYTLAQEWLNSGLLNRKLTKRVVMTLPYGATIYSAKDYIVDRIKEARDKDHITLPWASQEEMVTTSEYNQLVEEEGQATAIYATAPIVKAGHWLASYVWQAIHETVISAVEGMDWLRKMASLVVRQNKPVSWVTPSGFVVLQEYVQLRDRRIKTTFSGEAVYQLEGNKQILETEAGNGVRVDLVLQEETDTLDASKHRSGIAPNFVHSMDASALVFAVNTARFNYGVENFALIHDSFGTHAADTESLAKAIRQSFIKMYSDHDVIGEFETQVKKVLPPDAEIPPQPQRGKLDLNQVYHSLYFFS